MNSLKTILLTIISLTTLASNKSVSCNTFYQIEWDIPVAITIKADIAKLDSNQYQFTKRTFILNMDEEADYSWYDFTGTSDSPITNFKDYSPRKYKGFIKVDITKDMPGFESGRAAPYGILGQVDFLLPKKQLDQATSQSEIEAVVILSYIADHWGGTRTLKCQVSINN